MSLNQKKKEIYSMKIQIVLNEPIFFDWTSYEVEVDDRYPKVIVRDIAEEIVRGVTQVLGYGDTNIEIYIKEGD